MTRSQETQNEHPDLVQGLRRHLEENVNAKNVIKLLNSFLKYIDRLAAGYYERSLRLLSLQAYAYSDGASEHHQWQYKISKQLTVGGTVDRRAAKACAFLDAHCSMSPEPHRHTRMMSSIPTIDAIQRSRPTSNSPIVAVPYSTSNRQKWPKQFDSFCKVSATVSASLRDVH